MKNSFSNDLKYSRPNRIKAGEHQAELRQKFHTTRVDEEVSFQKEFQTHALIWVCLIIIISVQFAVSSDSSKEPDILSSTVALEELFPEPPQVQIVQNFQRRSEKQKPKPQDLEKSWKAFQENRVLYQEFLKSGSI